MAYQMARLSVAYGLDPFLKELVVLGDNVYPTVAGLHRKANENDNYAGEILRPATMEERTAFYFPFAPPDDEYLWICHVFLRNRDHPVVGWGRASKQNVKMSTMLIWLPEMAQKRARGRAYRIAFNIGIPVIEEMYEFEDGTSMRTDPANAIVPLATPEDIERIESEILKQEYLDSGVVCQVEWDGTKKRIAGQVTKETAEKIKLYFLGEDGVIARRIQEKKGKGNADAGNQ